MSDGPLRFCECVGVLHGGTTFRNEMIVREFSANGKATRRRRTGRTGRSGTGADFGRRGLASLAGISHNSPPVRGGSIP